MSVAGELKLGARFGNYVLEAVRGQGGYATVYRALTDDGATVALKILHPELVATNSKPLKRFELEIDLVKQLDHPNIVKVIEAGVFAGHPFCAMEWLDGVSIDEELTRRGPLTSREAIFIIDALAAALGAAHALGIVHRDIKSSNVMLVRAPSPAARPSERAVKLLDFGIAKLIDGSDRHPTGLTSINAMVGTPHYMSPEQIVGMPVDARADIYALGVLLYKLVTARFPFHAAVPQEVVQMHLHSAPPRAGDRAPVHPAIDEIIQRCMQKRPGERFRTTDELRAAIGHGRQSAPTEPPTAASRPAAAPVVAPALAVRVEVELASGIDLDDVEDRVLDDIANVLAIAHAELASSDFVITTSAGNLVVAVAALPVTESFDKRAQLLQRLLHLCHELERRADAQPEVRASIIASEGRASQSETGYTGRKPDTHEGLLVTLPVLDGLKSVAVTSVPKTELVQLRSLASTPTIR